MKYLVNVEIEKWSDTSLICMPQLLSLYVVSKDVIY